MADREPPEREDGERRGGEPPWPVQAWRYVLARAGLIILALVVLNVAIQIARDYL